MIATLNLKRSTLIRAGNKNGQQQQGHQFERRHSKSPQANCGIQEAVIHRKGANNAKFRKDEKTFEAKSAALHFLIADCFLCVLRAFAPLR
jgi:hypothetical protein